MLSCSLERRHILLPSLRGFGYWCSGNLGQCGKTEGKKGWSDIWHLLPGLLGCFQRHVTSRGLRGALLTFWLYRSLLLQKYYITPALHICTCVCTCDLNSHLPSFLREIMFSILLSSISKKTPINPDMKLCSVDSQIIYKDHCCYLFFRVV